MLTPATPIADLDQWEGIVSVSAGLMAAVDRSDPALDSGREPPGGVALEASV